MADKTPIRGAYDGSSVTGLAEYATGDTVSVGFGGTGATSLTDNGILIGNNTGAIQVTSALTTNGQIVIGGSSGPAVANISGTSNEVEITDGDGTITIGLPATVCALTCVAATCLGGTLQTAAQANITSVGTLTSLNSSGDVSFDGGTFVFNESGADKDFRVEGDTEANLFIADASTDRIGIGTATPSHLLDVEGVANVATCIITPVYCVASEYVLPSADGSAGQVMCTDGSGALAFATNTPASPGGSDTYVQFNDSDSFGGSANLTWDDTTLKASNICTAGTATLATVTATAITGTIGTAAQGSITSLGNLTSLCVTGDTVVGGDLTIAGDDLTMGTNTSGYILVADGTNYNPVAVSGDVTISSAGAITIAADAVENSMLANCTVSYGGVSLALGGSDATPAFDLTDATNYPTSSLVGTITNTQLAGSIANAKLANSTITVSDGSNTTAIALGGTATFSGTSNEVEVSESSGTLTIGLPSTVSGLTTVSATNLTGTLSTAAQTNITSVGNLSSLCVTGDTVVGGDLTIGGDDLTMGTNTSGALLVADGTNFNPVVMSGDASISTAGAVTLAATNTNLTTLANVTTVGTIGSGTWQGTAIATGYIATTLTGKTLTTATLTSPVLNGTLSGTAFLDEDNMASDSAIAAASQQSIKAYVDAVASGLDMKCSSHVATTACLTSTYNNGSSGVGATLTNAGTQAALSIDGQTLASSERVLIKDQTAACHNGIYSVTTVGDGSTNWVITRTTDFDSSTEVTSGAFTFIETGSTNGDHGFVMTSDGTITIGTTAINWTQFSGAGQITAGAGMTKSGNTLNVIAGSNITVNADDVALSTTITGVTSLSSTCLTGTLQTAVQSNVTSLGNLSSLCVSGPVCMGSGISSGSTITATTLCSSGDLVVAGDDITMGTNTSGYILVADGTNYNPVAVSGDVTISDAGAVTIAAGAVENSMLANCIVTISTNSGVSQCTSLALGGMLTIEGTSNEIEVSNSSNVVTIGLPSTVSGLTTVSATTLTGTLSTAAQTAVTSVGTLSSLCISGTLDAGGNVSLNGGTFVFNEAGADKDFRIEGDSEANLFIADASVDRIGIGTATPSHLLDVEGVAHVATCIVTPKVCISSQYALPAADGSAGEILCTDGSGAIAFAEAASSGHTISDEGSVLAARTCLNFVGSAVTATDNSGANATDVTVCATNALLGIRAADGTACCITLTSSAIGECLQSDTSPKLGGNLDVNGNSIVSDASNENIPITPHGTGSVVISKADINGGAIDGTTIGAASTAAGSFLGITGTTLTATGNVSFDGGTFVFNESGADKDFRIEGDSEVNLFIADASTDRIGIGTATPSHLVDIEGVAHAATCFVSADVCATTKVVSPALCIGSQYALPAADGSAGQIMCTDGSGALAFATVSAGVTLSGSTDNTIATVTGSNALQGEANLTFDGTTLTVGSTATLTSSQLTFADDGLVLWGSSDTAYIVGKDSSDGYLKFATNASERMRIDPSGNVGIGTAAFDVSTPNGISDPARIFKISSGNDNDCDNAIQLVGYSDASGNSHGLDIWTDVSTGQLYFDQRGDHDNYDFRFRTKTSGTAIDAMTIAGNGYVGIGTTNPLGPLDIHMTPGNYVRISDPSASTTASETVLAMYGSTDATTRLGYVGFGSTAHSAMTIMNDQSDYMSFGTAATERMRLAADGSIGMGTQTPCGGGPGTLSLYKDANNYTRFWDNAVATTYVQSSGANSPSLVMKNAAGGEYVINVFQHYNAGTALFGHYRCCMAMLSWNGSGPHIVGNYGTHPLILGTNNAERVCIACGGAVTVHGAFAKGSGSFNIAHPLESKKETHRLVHSFIEGPQADLIYRGVAQLVDGRAEINVDTEAGMTEGTFVVLNRCVQVFTTNETNWDLIKGSVTGNILTIESNISSSTACISWMVVGERQDEHMKQTDTDWTDDDGRPIIEPLAPIKEPLPPIEEEGK